MLIIVLVAVLGTAAAQTSDVEEIPTRDKAQCIKQFVKWCNSMQYPETQGSVAIVSMSYKDNTDFYRVYCASDSEGTNCKRNGSPWVSCTPDNTLKYKDEILTESTTDVDDEICKTEDRLLNGFFVQNSLFNPYQNKTTLDLEEGLQKFFEELAAMQKEIYNLRKKFFDDMWNSRDGGMWTSREEDPWDAEATPVRDVKKKDSNKIERIESN